MHAWLLGALLGCGGADEAPTQPPPPPTPEKAPPPEGQARCDSYAPIFPSHGVHSPCGCPDGGCDAARGPDDPPDPRYPEHWVAEWTMYRIFAPQPDNPPPYADPPAGLEAGTDYEASSGVTHYDSAYVPPDRDGVGAILERYEGRCLPVFPRENTFSCTIASLGNKAWLLTDDADRPADMAACCLFSPYHHAPRRDFIRHLPYSPEDSDRLGEGALQAYRYAVTRQGADIWFGYAFHADQPLDAEGTQLRPHSFYFTGAATAPPQAPVVSQVYTRFSVEQPGDEVWAPVLAACGDEVPVCGLFDADPARFSSAPEQQSGLIGSGWDDLHGGAQRPPPPPPAEAPDP